MRQSESASSLDELEDAYQLQRILDEGDVRARIDSVHVADDSVYLTLLVGRDYEFTLYIGASNSLGGRPVQLRTLEQLCNELGLSFSRDLSHLVGEEVTIESYRRNPEKIKIREGGVGLRPIVDEPPASARNSQRLSRNAYISVQRYNRHKRNEDEFTEAVITDVAVQGDDLLLSLEVYGKLLQWSVDIPERPLNSGSEYETIVEELGGGSVKQVERSSVYVTPQPELGSAPYEYQNVLGTASDLLTTWVIFPSKKDIEKPKLTTAARVRYSRDMNYNDVEPNNPEAWEKRPIPYSTVHQVENIIALVFGAGLVLGFLTGETGGYLMLASAIGVATIKIFKFLYYYG